MSTLITPSSPSSGAQAHGLVVAPRLFPDSGHGPYRLLRAGMVTSIDEFDASLRDPAAAVQRSWARIRHELAGSQFAQEQGIHEATSLDELRARVPIRNHQELLPWLDRVAAGETAVLSRSPPQMLLETSGTTGRPKWLPVNAPWIRSTGAAQQLWMLGLLRDDEGLAKGRALANVSKAVSGRAPGGLPVGSNTGRMFLAQPWWIRWRAAAPYACYALDDPELRAYCILRMALCRDVVSWTTANPSTLLLFCRHLKLWWDELSADCADGTLSHGPAAKLDRRARRAIAWWMPRRRLSGPPLPSAQWPLRRITCWKGGASSFFLERLPEALGRAVPVREVGVNASEGFFAVPVDEGDPVLWLPGHLIELVDDAGEVHWPWQVEVGREYRLVVTTEAGLVRYDMLDVVRVTGFCGAAPRVVFLRKSGNVLNSTGEKVTEDQIAEAARVAFPAAIGVSVSLAWAEVPSLIVAVEGDGQIDAFEAQLQRLNLEYAAKRQSGRLGPPRLHPVVPGTFLAWRRRRVAAGAPDAQVKDPLVLSSERWAELVAGQGVNPNKV